MRLSVLVFALGVCMLQWLPALPEGRQLAAGALGAGVCWGVAGWLGIRARSSEPWCTWISLALVVVAAFVAGICWAAWRADLRLADHLPMEWEGRDVEVIGIVAEMPQPFPRGERFAFDIEQILTPSATLPARVMLSWYGDGSFANSESELSATSGKVVPGERWRFVVRMKRPHGNANPFAFDYEAWLLERNLRATGYVRTGSRPQRLDSFVWRPDYVIELFRHDIRRRFLDDMSGGEFAGILVALAIGDQRAIQGKFWSVFARTGTTHLMSISGLHVTMFATFLGGLAGWILRCSPWLVHRLPAQRAAVFVGLLAAIGYALLSGFSVPAQRTAYMLGVAALATLSERRSTPSTVMALALLVVLLIDPWAGLTPGFWLSFVAVGLLFYVSTSRIRVRSWRAKVSEWGGTQWAVTVGSLPLLLLFFQQLSLVSPLANAVAIPVVSLLVTPIALLAIIFPWPMLLAVDHWILKQLMAVLVAMAELPVMERAAPPAFALVLACLGVFWMLLPRGIPRRWLGIFLLVPAVLYVPPRPVRNEAWVDVLDVGQGLAVLVRTAERNLLYDAGPLYSAESDAGQRVVVPYLRALGIKWLDTMIVTHRDTDHSGGAASVMAIVPVGHLLSPGDDLPGEFCAAGMSWEWDGVSFALLYPLAKDEETLGVSGVGGGKRIKSNHQSCVLRIAAGGRVMLLTSDIEAADERTLMDSNKSISAKNPLRADVLLVPHHGSRTSSSLDFVRSVSASDVIYSVGYLNRFGHPRADVVARYGQARTWRTDADGAVRVELADELKVSAWRREAPRYWQDK